MKFFFCLVLTLILESIFAPAFAHLQFDSIQLAQLEKKNICTNCDLSYASIHMNHGKAILNNTNLSNIKPIDGVFNFSGGSFINANLTNAFLFSADFSGAVLTNAHFDGANLQQANLYGAIDANLTNANICDATLPNGSKGPC